MANTLISDVFVPEIYEGYEAVDSPEKTAFFESGVAISSPVLDAAASEGGKSVEIPFWKDLDASVEPNYSSDASGDVATPQKVVAGEQTARKAFVNQGYSSADLASELAGSDPMTRVKNRFGTYWVRQWQRRTIATLNGVLADNVANDSSDMVNDIAGATNADVVAGTLFSKTAFTGAAFTSGDHFDDYVALSVHSVVYKRMVDNEDVEDIYDADGRLVMKTFMGRRIIVDDGMPYTPAVGAGAADAAPRYTSVLYGSGAIGSGNGVARTPVELARSADQGNGGGIETLWERKQIIIHPFGTAFTSDTVAGQSATWAELALAVNWNRVVDRKSIPMAFLVTNG